MAAGESKIPKHRKLSKAKRARRCVRNKAAPDVAPVKPGRVAERSENAKRIMSDSDIAHVATENVTFPTHDTIPTHGVTKKRKRDKTRTPKGHKGTPSKGGRLKEKSTLPSGSIRTDGTMDQPESHLPKTQIAPEIESGSKQSPDRVRKDAKRARVVRWSNPIALDIETSEVIVQTLDSGAGGTEPPTDEMIGDFGRLNQVPDSNPESERVSRKLKRHKAKTRKNASFVIKSREANAAQLPQEVEPRKEKVVSNAPTTETPNVAPKKTEIESKLDPRIDFRPVGEPVEELVEVCIDDNDPTKTCRIGIALPPHVREPLIAFLKEHKSTFAWSHEDMPGIDPSVITHRLNISSDFRPVKQRRRTFSTEKYQAINAEVDKLLKAKFIRESIYPDWLANVVMVKKSNGKWRMCVDFTNLNKACPKDSFPLPRIDQLVDATAGHELLTFMDAYSGYNQIRMHEPDEENTSFFTDQGIYCYRAMPFGLKNAGATYQRLVNKMFKNQIGKSMEVYVDDMLVKSLKAEQHVERLAEAFAILDQYQMKLNPAKCAFGVASGKFLGFMVNYRGIEANPEKIKALREMESPKCVRDVQRLTGRVAALNRFISRATDKCRPFFQTLKKTQDFAWTPECETAFEELKQYLGDTPLISKPKDGETLFLYLAVSEGAVSSTLIRNDDGVQRPVYYVSKALHDAETRYTELEKLALALVLAARKLRPYFQAHSIVVPTKFPIKQVLQRPEISGRLAKWAIELGEFDINFVPRTAIKGQALADFVAEFAYPPEMEDEQDLESTILSEEVPDGETTVPSAERPESRWTLYVDGSSTDRQSGAGVVLISPEGASLSSSIRFAFQATNNQAEYEALLAGMRLAKEVSATHLEIFSDSQLVVGQMTDEYQAKEEKMALYQEKAKKLLKNFKMVKFTQIPREKNTNADALARLATALEDPILRNVPIVMLDTPSIEIVEADVHAIAYDGWRAPIVEYLKNGTLPDDRVEARKLRARSARYWLKEGVLYRRGLSTPYLRCLGEAEAQYVMSETHEGVCGDHSGARALAHKVLRQGYFWPTLQKDTAEYVKKCDKCQRYSPIARQPPKELTSVTAPWPFSKWGIDIIGPLPKASNQAKFLLVAIDYYTKWVEAKALSKITDDNIVDFVWKNIVCRFGVPHTLVSDHGSQFDCRTLKDFCADLGIVKTFSSVAHPMSNGQVEAVNKTIKKLLKKKLKAKKGSWSEELPMVLWSYRTTRRTATGETPFSMAYGAEAMVPVELGIPTLRAQDYSEDLNEETLALEKDLLEERRDMAAIRVAAYQQIFSKHFNSKVKERRFEPHSLVLRKVFPNTKEKGVGTLGPNWEGPYVVRRIVMPGTYELETLDGTILGNPWHAEHLRQYYQ